MTKIILHGLAARRGRALLTITAVALGVTMVSGTLVFTDTIRRSFDQIFAHATAGADIVVSGRGSEFGRADRAPSIKQPLAARIAAIAGVARMEGQIQDSATLIGKDSRPVGDLAAPTLALSYTHAPFQPITITRGTPPHTDHQVAIDEATARDQHIVPGQLVEISADGPRLSYRVTGLAHYGDAATGGASFLVFDLSTAQQLFHKPNRFDALYVTARPHTTPAQLLKKISPLLPAAVQARTARQQISAQTRAVQREVGLITGALLAFAFVAVLAGAFVIFNSFSITVAQRTRELALMRTLGATRAQVLGAVTAEAAILGAAGAAAGTGLGLLGARGIDRLFTEVGARLPQSSPTLEPRTIAVGLATGIVVTLAAALHPALRATRVTPMAGLAQVRAPRSRLTPLLALTILAGGVVATWAGALRGQSTDVAATGAAMVVIGLTLLGPRLVVPMSRAAAAPLRRLDRLAASLARLNTTRNPARTSTTAGALMVGLGAALFVAIFAGGARSAVRDVVARSFTGDLALVNRDGRTPIPVAAADTAAAVPGVQAASVLKQADTHISAAGTRVVTAHGIDPVTLGFVYRFDWREGGDERLGFLGPEGALIDEHLADRASLIMGSSFQARDRAGVSHTFFVSGIYRDSALLGGFAVGIPAFNALFGPQRARMVLVKVRPGADFIAVRNGVRAALRSYPQVAVRSERELADAEASRLDNVLELFYALLALSVAVSFSGIVNALSLSVYERSRELGVLRAVGMPRRRLRRVVRYEGFITSAIGAGLGLLLGMFFGAVLSASLSRADFEFSVPWAQVGAIVGGALVLGVVAAGAPARRAGRLEIVSAITDE